MATTVTVRELIAKVSAGAVRIPRFQRPLRWRDVDVVKLLDSISKGYPVGSLLFWKREAPAEPLQVGGATISTEHTEDAWWVVDGQQRTTALAASLLDLDHGGDVRWVVSFDPATNSFRSGPPNPEEEGRVVPVSVLGDLRRLGRWIRDSPLDEASTDLLEQVQQRLLDYAIPAYVVDTEDEQALRAVFARLNSTGTHMREDEVFHALYGAPYQSGAASLDLDALQNACDVDGFGKPLREDVLRAVLAMAGHEPFARTDVSELDSAELPSRGDAERVLTNVREFLFSQCGVPTYSLLPYPVAFVILVKWFYLHPDSDQPTRQQLARWFWREAAAGVHQGADAVRVVRMRLQSKKITSDLQGSLARLLAQAPSDAFTASRGWSLQRFGSRSARSRLETLALLSRRPRDKFGEVSIAEVEGRLAREIFSSNTWDALDRPDRGLATTAANRAILDARDVDLDAHLREWDAVKDAERLRTHLIDETSFRLLLKGEVGAFLHRRAEAVRECVESFLRDRCAWEEPLFRLPDAYIDKDDP
ncbi:MAG: DUF262 domain-containing protein [Kofleriaceae bacterium]